MVSPKAVEDYYFWPHPPVSSLPPTQTGSDAQRVIGPLSDVTVTELGSVSGSLPYAPMPRNIYISGPRYRVMYDGKVTPNFGETPRQR